VSCRHLLKIKLAGNVGGDECGAAFFEELNRALKLNANVRKPLIFLIIGML